MGQNFGKVFDVKFIGEDKVDHYVWQTSWGITTRLIGAMVMVHGDDKGLIMPPKVAPTQVVIVPIPFKGAEAEAIAPKPKKSLKLSRQKALALFWMTAKSTRQAGNLTSGNSKASQSE